MKRHVDRARLLVSVQVSSTAAVQRGVLLLASALSATPCLHAQSIAWVRQYAYSGDNAAAVATGPNQSLYVAGLTYGNVDGQHFPGWDGGFGDAYVTKTDSTGYNYGSRQLGSSFTDFSQGVATDALGNVFVVGSTEGSMFKQNLGGNLDGILLKFNGDTGATISSLQLGTTSWDECRAVAADGLGNAYIAGYTSGKLGTTNYGGGDAFLYKSSASGPDWTRQFGTTVTDEAFGVAADRLGNVYVAGATSGDLGAESAGGQDAFLTKFNSAGSTVWTQQFGTATDDVAKAAVADGLGNVYVSGYTSGNLTDINAGGRDAFVRKYDATGELLWSRLLGTGADDQANAIAVDGLGNVFTAGKTAGELNGNNLGQGDVFVTKLSGNGQLGWTRQFGTTANDEGLGVAADGAGGVYVSGATLGGMWDLAPDAQGNGGNAFLLKIVDPNLPGDFNFDGRVDAADYTRWRDGLGTTYGQNAYAVWKAYFGQSNGAGALFDGLLLPAVPEPTSASLLVIGFILASFLANGRQC